MRARAENGHVPAYIKICILIHCTALLAPSSLVGNQETLLHGSFESISTALPTSCGTGSDHLEYTCCFADLG